LRLRRSCWPSSISRKITMSRAVSKPNTTDEGGCSDERVHGVDVAFPLHGTACLLAGSARRAGDDALVLRRTGTTSTLLVVVALDDHACQRRSKVAVEPRVRV
jgi:hypothetical protein